MLHLPSFHERRSAYKSGLLGGLTTLPLRVCGITFDVVVGDLVPVAGQSGAAFSGVGTMVGGTRGGSEGSPSSLGNGTFLGEVSMSVRIGWGDSVKMGWDISLLLSCVVGWILTSSLATGKEWREIWTIFCCSLELSSVSTMYDLGFSWHDMIFALVQGPFVFFWIKTWSSS